MVFDYSAILEVALFPGPVDKNAMSLGYTVLDHDLAKVNNSAGAQKIFCFLPLKEFEDADEDMSDDDEGFITSDEERDEDDDVKELDFLLMTNGERARTKLEILADARKTGAQ